MNRINAYLTCVLCLTFTLGFAQEEIKKEREPGHTNQSKFKQLYEEFATPNTYRSASGTPGPDYYQQQADYKIDIELDDRNAKIFGEETITYFNNSPDDLEYLWLQLDQNVRAKDSKAPLRDGNEFAIAYSPDKFAEKVMQKPFDGGFNIEFVRDSEGKNLPHTINQTMMRIDLPQVLKSGAQVSF